MKNNTKDLLAPCGLYCGICRVYLAYKNKDKKLKEEILPYFKQWGAKNVNDLACCGCMSNGPIFPFCLTCKIKDCIKEKGIQGCYQCDLFPCDIIKNWPSQAGKEVILKEIPEWRKLGTEKWIEKIEKEYQCPQCGKQLYRGVEKCNACGYKFSKAND